MNFNRVFSMSMYKSMRIRLGEMSFQKDFINNTRGDLYPVIQKSEDCRESVVGGRFLLQGGVIERLLCRFFPFASYEVCFEELAGDVGFGFCLPDATAYLTTDGKRICFACGERRECVDLPEQLRGSTTMIVSCRPRAFDVYFRQADRVEYAHTVYEERFGDSNRYDAFANAYVHLFAAGKVVVKDVLSYLDNGISIADIRPIKYENGDVMLEQGKMYFTASIRMHEGAFQGVFSWIPGTAEFSMTGAMFYDCGDGYWRNYLAPVIIHHRQKGLWYVFVSSFEHRHVLAYGSFAGDPRFGVNVVDVRLMEEAKAGEISDFVGFRGDEDPDLMYDAENGRWLLAICRIDPTTDSYVYVFFESAEPFAGYRYIGKGMSGAETGGSFVKIDGELHFVCGNDFKKTSEYRIYNKAGMTTASFRYPDGGFRGWGSVIPVTVGSRTRYFWLTFDRHSGSAYRWSYGNLYCFEMDR